MQSGVGVNSGMNSVGDSHLAKLPRVENITFQNKGTTRMTTTKPRPERQN
jgi:hypothetical protein